METLTAFVRERTRPEAERLVKPRELRIEEGAYLLWKNAGSPEGRSSEFWREAVKQEAQKERPATDIAAVLEVIRATVSPAFLTALITAVTSDYRKARRCLGRHPWSPRSSTSASWAVSFGMA